MNKSADKKIDSFFSKFKPLYYKKGEILIRPDESILGTFLLKKGLVRKYVISPSGEELTVHVYRPITFFPTIFLIEKFSNHYFYEAISDVQVNRAPANQIIEFIKSEPEVLLELTRHFAQGLEGLTERIEELTLEKTSERIINLIIYLSNQYGSRVKNKIIILMPLTHKNISDWLGMTRETTSRELEKLKSKDLISYNNKTLIVKNINKLKKEAEKYK
ncbi:MAG TPA: Crp/Fnr family transcriptional regulator [Patescibacteria group bacterium]